MNGIIVHSYCPLPNCLNCSIIINICSSEGVLYLGLFIGSSNLTRHYQFLNNGDIAIHTSKLIYKVLTLFRLFNNVNFKKLCSITIQQHIAVLINPYHSQQHIQFYITHSSMMRIYKSINSYRGCAFINRSIVKGCTFIILIKNL